MEDSVALLVPVKPLALAKTRLRASPDSDGRSAEAHMELVMAMAVDTIAAARAAVGVAEVVAVSADQRVTRALARMGIATIQEGGPMGLNRALVMGSRTLSCQWPQLQIGALNADLPALQPTELSSAVHLAAGRRAFCRDRAGTGTTLLLAGIGEDLDPCFGPWSASAHLQSGATELAGAWPGLCCDVDTESDLSRATRLGLGSETRSLLLDLAHAQSGTGT